MATEKINRLSGLASRIRWSFVFADDLDGVPLSKRCEYPVSGLGKNDGGIKTRSSQVAMDLRCFLNFEILLAHDS